MKRTIKLAVVAALALGATSAFATNGSSLIGIGAKARGMGGTAIGVGHGAESGISNPALITTIKGNNEISFGGTIFMPTIKTSQGLDMMGPGGPGVPDGVADFNSGAESDSDFFVIPAVSLASKLNDNFYWGIGMWGTGGLGVDYRDTKTLLGGGDTQMNMVTALQTMQFGVPLAYTNNGFSIGITPIVQYSSLDIQYTFADDTFSEIKRGAGVSQDISTGIDIGLAYQTDGITIGAVYKSKIVFNVDDVLSETVTTMQRFPYTNDELATPEEYGVGISYTTQGHTLALDWKRINWEDAETYEDFGWEDQDIIAVGYEYSTNDWAVRCGYQYAESAVQDNTGKGLPLDSMYAPGGANLSNTFNLLGFPGTQESHITLGGSYAINETLSMDLAAVYGLKNTETLTNFTAQQIKTEHSEQSYSIQVNYAF